MPTCTEFIVVDLIPSSTALAADINRDGYVCGWDEQGIKAFLFVPQQPNSAAGTIVYLTPTTGTNASARGINNRVDVVGWSAGTAAGLLDNASLWLDCGIGGGTGYTLLSLLPGGGGSSRANAINDLRNIVGWSNSLQPTGGVIKRRAVLWDGGRPNDPPVALAPLDPNLESEAYGINNQGTIVGSAQVVNSLGNVEEHAVVWNSSTLQIIRDLGTLNSLFPVQLTTLNAEASAINDNGTIIGTGDVPLLNARTGFIVPSGGNMQLMPIAPSLVSGASHISPNGTSAVTTAVVDSYGQTVNHGATFSPQQVIFDIDTTPCGAQPGGHGLSGGWLLNEARGVNDFGQICGRGSSPYVQRHALLIVPTN